MTRFLSALLLPFLLSAQDTQLAALRSTVLSLRKQFKDQQNVPAATPEVTVAKHQLRDWIESRANLRIRTGGELANVGDFVLEVRVLA